MKFIENNPSIIDVKFNDNYAIDMDYLTILYDKIVEFNGYTCFSISYLNFLCKNYFKDYTMDIFNSSYEEICSMQRNNLYEISLKSNRFIRQSIKDKLEQCNSGIRLFKRFSEIDIINKYYKNTNGIKALYEYFLNIQTVDDLIQCSSKYILYNLLRDERVCLYFGLNQYFNGTFRREPFLSLRRDVLDVCFLEDNFLFSDLDEMIKNLIYPANNFEWVFDSEILDTEDYNIICNYLQKKFDKPLFLKLLIKTLVNIVYNNDFSIDKDMHLAILRLSFGMGYINYRNYFYQTTKWYSKQKNHLTVRPDKYFLKQFFRLNNISFNKEEFNKYVFN